MRLQVVWLMVGTLIIGAAPAWAAKKKPAAPAKADAASEAKADAATAQAPAPPQGVTLDPAVLKAIEELAAKDPSFALRAYSLAAEGYRSQNQPDRALAIYESTAKAFPDDEDVLTRLAGLYQQQGRYEAVRPLADRLAGLRPENVYYHQLAAGARSATGDAAGGTAVWKAAVAARPDDAEFRFHYAQALHQQKKTEEALQQFEAVVQRAPGNLSYAEYLAEVYASVNRLDEAIAHYETLLGKAPDEARKTSYASRLEQLKGQKSPSAPAAAVTPAGPATPPPTPAEQPAAPAKKKRR